MCRIASLSLLQRMKGSVAGDARNFNIETLAVIKPPKDIHAIMTEALGGHAPSYTIV